MTDGDALLKAILADPADDTVRLTYADWLDEQAHPVPWVSCPPCRGAGEVTYDMPAVSETRVCGACAGDGAVLGVHPLAARAEFIRLQVESALFASLRDGDLSKSKVYAAYLRRENALLAAHRRDWLGGQKCGACGGKGDMLLRNRAPELATGPKDRRRAHCRHCRGTEYECWPLLEMTHGRFGSVVGSVENIRSHFTRGFVSRVELRAEQYTAEVARLVFTHHPTITEVELTDADVWQRDDGTWTIGGDIGGTHRHLPFALWDLYADPDNGWPHPTREEALSALSAACVAWGRELAGLPPLTPR